MILSLAVFAVVGTALVAGGSRLGRGAFLVGALPAAWSAVSVVVALDRVTAGVPVTERVAWVPGLDLGLDLRLDGLAATMTLIVCGVGVAVLVYAAHYFAPDAPDLGRLAGLLVLFAGSMVALVQADHVLVLFAGWELTSITSFLLIGNRHDESRARAAAVHALLVTGAGGFALLGGLLVLAHEAGSHRLTEIVARPPEASAALTAALVLILLGALTKSAQYPFHAWLPGAMAAPTPVSAYLHSATMVKAGVFLVACLAPAFAGVGPWRPIVLVAGCATLVFGGLRALRQHDVKVLLAFGTVSQLGLLMVLFGAGTPATTAAGWALVVAHAAFKAALFMVVGVVDHQTGTRDIRRLPALGAGWRPLEVVTVVAAASMAGLPLTAGFIAKESAYASLADAPFGGAPVVLAAVVAGSMLTVAYAIRFWWGVFVAPRRRAAAPAALTTDAPPVVPPGAGIVAPAAVLAALGIVLGVAPGLGDALAGAAVAAYGESSGSVHLSLWHGFGLPLGLSVLAVAGGVLLAAGDRVVQPVLARGGVVPSGAESYVSALQALGTLATRVTGVVQSGSLPVYAGVILVTAAAAPGVALIVGGDWPGLPPVGGLEEAPFAIVLLVAALGAAIVRRRFAAAVFLGVAGYAMAGLFVVSGAPDLALTQVAVETLSTVVFVLVLRRLPERFERESTRVRRVVRLAIAVLVGVTVFGFAIVASGYRLTPDVSQEMVARSLPDGHGRNVVNVILVDFRGFDTLGEITVLAVASIGAVALARVGRRAADERGHAPAGHHAAASLRRLPFVEVSARLVFPAIVLMALWLLFAGHNQPGGGFVGGLMAGSAIALRFVAGGMGDLRSQSRFRPWTVLGAGLVLAAATAAAPLVFGGSVLEVGSTTLDLPLLGHVNLSSALLFDTGVFLAVIGMVLMVFEAFGDDPVEAPA